MNVTMESFLEVEITNARYSPFHIMKANKVLQLPLLKDIPPTHLVCYGRNWLVSSPLPVMKYLTVFVEDVTIGSTKE